VDLLVKAGVVERRPDTKDRRVINMALTEKGRATAYGRKAEDQGTHKKPSGDFDAGRTI